MLHTVDFFSDHSLFMLSGNHVRHPARRCLPGSQIPPLRVSVSGEITVQEGACLNGRHRSDQSRSLASPSRPRDNGGVTTSPDADYKQRLEEIAGTHLIPDPAQKADAVLRSHIRDRIMRWVRGPEVLEMGAGELMWTQGIVESFGHSSIVDGSGSLLKNARAVYGDKITCYDSLFEEFLPPDGIRFDTVIATHVLEHVNDPVAVLQHARKWLAPGGRIIVAVPNATSLHRRLGVKMGLLKTVYDFSERDYLAGHRRVYDLNKLKADATAAGLKILHEQGFVLKILSAAMMVSLPLALTKAMADLGDELPPEMLADIGLVLEP
jgi:2-polyprenyl-3-methyl-5-hydroxy-6-metoxy-1,4-benzoquinol methylase